MITRKGREGLDKPEKTKVKIFNDQIYKPRKKVTQMIDFLEETRRVDRLEEPRKSSDVIG